MTKYPGSSIDPNICSGSPTYEWRKVRIPEAFPPGGDSLPQAVRPRAWRTRSRYKAVTVTIVYRAGPESSWLITCGQKSWRVPGYSGLDQIMPVILREVTPWTAK